MQGGIFVWKRKDKNMARKSFYIRDKQEVKAITDQLEEGLKELFAKEKYKTYPCPRSLHSEKGMKMSCLICSMRQGFISAR